MRAPPTRRRWLAVGVRWLGLEQVEVVEGVVELHDLQRRERG